MLYESESRISAWVRFIQQHWSQFRSLAAEKYNCAGRGAFIVNIYENAKSVQELENISYLTIDSAKEILGDLESYPLRDRARTYNPERQVLFYFWDSKKKSAKPRELSELPNGTPEIDMDALWCNRERTCPQCGTSFTSIRDHGQCPNCACHFNASSIKTPKNTPNDNSKIPPIVEVVCDTSSAKNIKSLIGLIFEKQIIRGEDSITQYESVIWDVNQLKAEVENGGFEQYLGNPSGSRVIQTIAALNCIGAVQSMAILEKACSLFPQSLPSPDCAERFDQMMALENQTHEPWEELDSQFYCVTENVDQLLWEYWQKIKEM